MIERGTPMNDEGALHALRDVGTLIDLIRVQEP